MSAERHENPAQDSGNEDLESHRFSSDRDLKDPQPVAGGEPEDDVSGHVQYSAQQIEDRSTGS